MVRPASHDEISQLLGDTDERTIERISQLGASASEVAEAVHRLHKGPRFDDEPLAASSIRVAEVRAILEEPLRRRDDDDAYLYEHSITAD